MRRAGQEKDPSQTDAYILTGRGGESPRDYRLDTKDLSRESDMEQAGRQGAGSGERGDGARAAESRTMGRTELFIP